MQDTADLLQIKIERAKALLPDEAQNAIAAVNWRTAILELRAKRGYTFEQLGDLEIETELVLSGLVKGEDYPKELAERMKISRREADEVVSEMNTLVFEKIKEELIKNTEKKKAFANTARTTFSSPYGATPEGQGGDSENYQPLPPPSPQARLPDGQGEEKKKETHPVLIQKITGPFKTPVVKTDHSMENITKSGSTDNTAHKNLADPYREIPE